VNVTGLDVLRCDAGWRNYYFLKLSTDQDVIGWSEFDEGFGSLGVTVAQRVLGTSASRWIPLAGAAAVGAYAYWDTLQVAKTARRVVASGAKEPAASEPAGASSARA